MHPHSTVRLMDELVQLPQAARTQVLTLLEGVPEAQFMATALAYFWSNHRDEL